ncbi:L-ascorbate oxidase homolog isoform X3 [Primulina eburnea]|uniref:L-ascorbate oxidase homolog isoform X3 n=1 Tax=Primulina eburnea TaxID=1245227 RepID=UPI003C6BF594
MCWTGIYSQGAHFFKTKVPSYKEVLYLNFVLFLDLLPNGQPPQMEWSIAQARTYRWNLTSNAARPNPSGSFHYEKINVSKMFIYLRCI